MTAHRHTAQRIAERWEGGAAVVADLRGRWEQYHDLIALSLVDLTEDEARAQHLPGAPPLLGVVRHTGFVEGVWLHERITGATRKQIGIPVATANSWKVRRSDTIASVLDERDRLHASARVNLQQSGDPARITPLLIQVLSELAWNTGQLDVLRAVVLASRTSPASTASASG